MPLPSVRRLKPALPLCLWIAACLLAVSGLPALGQSIRLRTIQFDPLQSSRFQAASAMTTATMPALALYRTQSRGPVAPGEQRLALIQWGPPLANADLQAILDRGGKLVQPIPDQAWIVALPPGDSAATFQSSVQAASFAGGPKPLRYAAAMAPGWKLDPATAKDVQGWYDAGRLKPAAAKIAPKNYYVQFARAGGEKELRDLLASRGANLKFYGATAAYETWELDATPDLVEDLAFENSVLWVAPYRERKMLGERDALVAAGQLGNGAICLNNNGLSYASWLSSVGLSGLGVVVQIMDDGLSKGIATNAAGTAHVDIVGRIAGIDNVTTDALGDSSQGHGHINTSIIMGQPIAGNGRTDSGGYKLGQGVAPNARIWATKIFNNSGRFDVGSQSFGDMTRRAYAAGARISSNSWGSPDNGAYTIDSQSFDVLTRDADSQTAGLQAMLFCFAAGNEGGGLTTLDSPGSAKNVIAVGATENCDQGILDDCGEGPANSDNLNDLANFSSRGPATDGRLGVTLVAPGIHVTGAASDDSLYSGAGVCGRDPSTLLPGEPASAKKYYPANQTDYTWSSGTSHSTPIVAGASALLYQYFTIHLGAAPSPALIRAALVAGADATTGGHLNDGTSDLIPSIPNVHSGWGRVNLANLVSGLRSQFVVDQTQILRANNATYQADIQVSDPSQPLRIVLAWTDPAASLSAANALVNDLDLTVSNGSATWLGNVFSNGASATGGVADRLNNLEAVSLPTPQTGVYHITVTAHALLGDALPGQGTNLEQDFALFVSNGSGQSPIGKITLDKDVYACGQGIGVSVTDADLAGKGKVDVTLSNLTNGDEETLTLNEVLNNSGILQGTQATDSAATKISGNGILTVRDGDQIQAVYHDATLDNQGHPLTSTAEAAIDCAPPQLLYQNQKSVAENGAVVAVASNEPVRSQIDYGTTRGSYPFSASNQDFAAFRDVALTGLAPCSLYFYRIRLTDKAGNLSIFDNNGLGYALMTRTAADDFADFLEPAPAAGWTHSAASGTDDWQPSAAQSHSPTHAWFASDAASIKDSSLVTPPLAVQTGARLSFWHTYQFEQAGVTTGYDGAVIEISNDNGASWTDLGSAIQDGGYNETIATGFQNPLAGRMAWSGGTIGAMTRVLVDLAPYAGQTVRIRFRIGCDTFVGATGWYIDDLELQRVVQCPGPLAQLRFDGPSVKGAAGMIHFTLLDSDLSQSSGGVPGPFSLAAAGQSTGPSVSPSGLQRIDPSGIWEGFLSIAPGSLPNRFLIGGVLDVAEGSSFRLLYLDQDVLGASYQVVATATVDSTPPILLSAQAGDIQPGRATIHIEANEPAGVLVEYGTTCGAPDHSFGNVALNTSFDIPVLNLIPCTSYFYRVTLTDAAGNAAVFDNQGLCFGFKTLSTSTTAEAMGIPGTPLTRGWTEINSPPVSTTWVQTQDPTRAHSSPYVMRVKDSATVADYSLVSPPVDLGSSSTLSFWHTYKFSDISGSTHYDGGVLEISTDDGSSWQDLSPYFTLGQYDAAISGGTGNPLGGRLGWTGGALGAMTQIEVNLSSFAGAARKVRWRMGSDSSVAASDDLWEIDDVSFTNNSICGTPFPNPPTGELPADGTTGLTFEAQHALSWTAAPGATHYKIYLGLSPSTMTQLADVTQTQANLPLSPPLKADTIYYWTVVALNATGANPGPIQTFRTRAVATDKIAKEVLGTASGLTATEKQAVDYNDDGRVGIDDLVKATNKKGE